LRGSIRLLREPLRKFDIEFPLAAVFAPPQRPILELFLPFHGLGARNYFSTSGNFSLPITIRGGSITKLSAERLGRIFMKQLACLITALGIFVFSCLTAQAAPSSAAKVFAGFYSRGNSLIENQRGEYLYYDGFRIRIQKNGKVSGTVRRGSPSSGEEATFFSVRGKVSNVISGNRTHFGKSRLTFSDGARANVRLIGETVLGSATIEGTLIQGDYRGSIQLIRE
jgi:hypothetical protein